MRHPVRVLLTRLLAVLVMAAAVAVAAAGPAAAGGPTSVLLASPYSDSAAALYYSDDDYAHLQSLLGGPDLPVTSAQPPTGVAGAPYVTVTWLIHDVSVWRIDRIFLVADGPWVVSESAADGTPITGDGMYPNQTGAAGAVWHRATDPAALTTFLTGHGLMPPVAGSPTAPAAAGAAGAAGTSQPEPATGWLWGIGGLIAGLLLGSAAVWLARTRRTRAATGTGIDTEPAPMLPIA